MNHSWPTLTMLAICFVSGAAQLYWGGQDHAGQFHADYLWSNGNLGMSLFFLGPYLLLAMSALVTWRQRGSLYVLMLTAAFCGISILVGWVDHNQYLRTPPGRGTPQMLNFFATPLLWLGSLIVLATVGKSRLDSLRASQKQGLVADTDP